MNKLTGYRMPIWVADFVLVDYGTGMVTGVPAHDQRDFEFAQKYGLEIKRVIRTRDGDDSPVERKEQVSEDGVMINSDFLNGQDAQTEAKSKVMDYLEKKGWGKRVVFYHLRDWLISRQRYWGAPIPMVYDPQGQAHPVKEEHLPLLLPTDVDYTPKGTSPLGSSKEYRERAEKLYGTGWHFEVDTMDTFVCSSWYYLRYCDPRNTKLFAAPDKLAKWLPVDLYVGGAEHAVLHLLYARFFHKALQDFGLIPKEVGREPFQALRNQGMILGEDHQKMSKSRGNVINPDDIVREYGADTLRLYEMFMGPFEDVKPWQSSSIRGVHRFLDKVFRLHAAVTTGKLLPDTERLLHQTIKQVSEHIEQFRFNTAISQLMILTNHLSELKPLPRDAYEQLLILLYPFAPHLTAEAWTLIGKNDIIWEQRWPQFDSSKLASETATIIVQINGKVRDQIILPRASTKEQVISAAQASSKIQAHLQNKTIHKTIYVPNKLINFVI